MISKGQVAGRSFAVVLGVLVAVFGVLMFAPGADARTGYASSFSFASPEGFNGPVGLAVDDSAGSSKGDVYVVDQGNEALKKFSVSGTTATQEWSVALPGATPNQASVDDFAGPVEGDVFVAGYGSGVIYRVNPAGTEVVEVLTGVANPTGVAVDSAGDFFVSSIAEDAVLEYNAAWEPIDAAGVPVLAGENKVMEGLNGVQTLAVSSTGEEIYAATGEGTIQATLLGGSYVTVGKLDEAPSNGVTVAPSGDVYVDQGDEVVFYEPSGTLLGRFGSGVLSGEAFGVGVSPSDAFVADHAAGVVEVFEAGVTPEVPETLAASAVAATSAVLNGTLKPTVGEPTVKYFFEYSRETGPSCAGGTRTPVREATGAVSEALSGLALGAQYEFCLRAVNRFGEVTGVSVAFTTVAIDSEDSPDVTASEATVAADIATSDEATSYQVQYGVASVSEHTVPEPAASAPASPTPTRVQQLLKGLAADTTYRFRFLSSNARGSVTGEERTFTTPAAASTSAETCPNAQRRGEQPDSATLPDCRAYEMVSPTDTNGQDATLAENSGAGSSGLRASFAGNAIAYESPGAFADPAGAGTGTEYLSRRQPDGWTTQAITPLQEPRSTVARDPSYTDAVFTPELSAGVASSTAPLVQGVPENPLGTLPTSKLYLAQLAGNPAEPSYEYVGQIGKEQARVDEPAGASSDLSHIVFGLGGASEWVNGVVSPVSVSNGGEALAATVGNEAEKSAGTAEVDTWNAVSADGSRVYFTIPGFELNEYGGHEPPGQLYVRVHAEQMQSPIVSPEANGTGTLTAGSNIITPLAVAAGTTSINEFEGETSLEVIPTLGRFAVGESISGPPGAIAPGTTITEVSEGASGTVVLHLSAAITVSGYMPSGSVISGGGPAPFAVGQEISGDGIQPETTITEAVAGKLTLSKPAASSGSGVELRAGGGCTVPADACTIDVSASQRLAANPAGIQEARFWGASTGAGGGPERVFFTSSAELTENAYTGPAGEGANLYECELVENDSRCVLSDLTGNETDASGEGAAVQGVVQIAEDGSYVYFVAKGALAAGASEQQCRAETKEEEKGEVPTQDNLGCNLYVFHDGGAPVFIATLAYGDEGDWHAGEHRDHNGSGPDLNTAAIDPSGTRLAFSSERPLGTVGDPGGYDNEQAEPGECEAKISEIEVDEAGECREVFLYDAEARTLVCASCNATGARPRGPASLGEAPAESTSSSYRRRNFSESGVLFFDSWDALVAGSAGGVENVYEYEGGRVYPISDTASGDSAFLLDASANGENVFFATDDRLLPSDTEGDLVVYDARENGGFPVSVVPSLVCSGEGCRAPESSQPEFAAPATSTFSGPGNLVPPAPAAPVKAKLLTRAQKLAAALKSCRRDRKKAKRASCEKHVRSEYGVHVKAKKRHAKTRKAGKSHG